jgi:glycine/serine hydroxymethyltransferase
MRGFDEADAREVAVIIAGSLEGATSERALRERVRKLCDRHPLYPGWRGYVDGRDEG